MMTEREQERQSVNKTLKGELTKLKEMTFQQKAEYIWDYYKVQILLILLGAILVGSLIHHYATRKIDVLFGIIVDAQCLTSEEITSDLNQFMGLTDRDTTYVEPNLYLRNSANFDTETKITCYVAARTLDYVIGDFAMMENFGNQGIMPDLAKFLPADVYEYFKDDIVTYTFTNPQSNTQYTQNYLRLNDYTFFSKYELLPRKEGDDLYLGVVSAAPHADNVIWLFRYIMSLGKTS